MWYTNRMILDAGMFCTIQKTLHESTSLSIENSFKGAHRTVRLPESEEAVLNKIEEHPVTKTRKIAPHFN